MTLVTVFQEYLNGKSKEVRSVWNKDLIVTTTWVLRVQLLNEVSPKVGSYV